jgi:N-acetylmuramoyl-L-alanine amidase
VCFFIARKEGDYVKICIDPGHGGTDPGAISGALYEKDVVLDVAIRLEKLLREAGHETFMTRVNDVFETPARKAWKANNTKADYFVSIHCNAADTPFAEGTETLVYELKGEEGKLGRKIQESLVESLKTRDRGVKERKDLIVLNSTSMIAVLVEIAFISNPKEKALLIDIDKRKAIAKAIFAGIQRHLGLYPEKTMEELQNSVKEKYNFSDETIEYLSAYKYSRPLLERLDNH